MRPVIIRGSLSACRKALAVAGSMFAQRQLVDGWDGATALNPAQIALTDRPIYWQGSALVLSVEDVLAMAEGKEWQSSARVVERAAERLLVASRPMNPLAEAGRLMQIAGSVRGILS